MDTETVTLEKLASLVQNLGNELQTALRTYTIALNDLGATAWKLARPILVTVEQHAQDDFVACFYDADIYGYGDSIPDSLEDLKGRLVNQFEFLLDESQHVELGPKPAKQLRVFAEMAIQGSS